MKCLLIIGIIGDYQAERPSHKATEESLRHCADFLKMSIKIDWLPTASFTGVNGGAGRYDGFWCAPGEYESTEGALAAIQFARENNVPFIGTCQGFQHTVIEYARNKLGLKDVRHVEFSPDAPNLIITALSCSFIGETRTVFIDKSSRVFGYYGTELTSERFTCNFGISPRYRKTIDETGLKIVGTDENGEARILDLATNDFFIATLFQPQLTSTPDMPHKLISEFLTHSEQFRRVACR